MVILLAAMSAHAASLDNLEIGGAWGTPAATNATAAWWNPAGLADGHGTRFLVEGAPILATVTFDREDPYRSGTDVYHLKGVVPFAGVATDAGVPGLGLGLALAVPFARGGAEETEPGVGSFAMRHGNSQAAYAMLAAAYAPKQLPIAFGLSGELVQNQWDANVDSELTTSLDRQIKDLGQDPGYTDKQIEDPNYTSTLDFSPDGKPLSATAVTFGAGVRVGITDGVVLALAYNHGAYVDNKGDATVTFGCPPQEDTLGRFGAEAYEICDTTLKAHGEVAYRLPSRLQAGLVVTRLDHVRAELMGGYVFWHAFDDFDITVSDVEDLNTFDSDNAQENTPKLVDQHRYWARDNHDTFWVGGDVKGTIVDGKLQLGGRVIYDAAAVPDVALSPNNYDANDLMLGALVAYKPLPWLTIGLQGTHHVVSTRTIDDSGYLVTLDPDKEPPPPDQRTREEDRWFYPTMNGTYASHIDRFALSVQGRFGKKDDDRKKKG